MQPNNSTVLVEAVNIFEWMDICIVDPLYRYQQIQELSAPEEKCWVNWKLMVRDGKPDKVPKMLNGRNAKPNDSSTWSTFAEVNAARSRFSGIGIMFTGKLLGIDLDHCIVNGEVSPKIATFIEKAHTYTEISPSGTGLHIYLPLTESMTLERNKAPRGIGADYECYTEKRWFTYTGDPWKESYAVRTVSPEAALDLLYMLGYPWKKESLPSNEVKSGPTGIGSLTDDELLRKMFSSKHGARIEALYNGDISAHGNDDSSADAALCSHLAFWTGKNVIRMESLWLASPLGNRSKTQDRKDYRDGTIAFAIENCRETYEEGSELKIDEPSQPSQSTQLVKLVLSNPDITLFLDQYQTTHVCFPIEEHFEVWPIDSSTFKYWLCDEFYKMSDGKAPGTNGISGALNVLEGRARAKGIRHTLHNRIAEQDGAIWYDLCDKEWRAIRIDKDGWKVISDTPILFRRHSYHQPQVLPVAGGNIRDVFQFVNIKEPDQQLLFLACMISFFIPGVPHPLLYIHGGQGCAKSSLLEIVHELVDPSEVGSLIMPRNLEDLKLLLDHHSAFASFDNVSYIHADIADLLCRAITGAGFERRKLYTNSETVICRIQANVAINGINLGSSRPDLLERSILLELTPIKKSDRRQDKELREAFQVAKPSLFGTILDIVVEVLRTKPSIQQRELPRMADFTVIGCAIASAIGSSQQEFLTAYQQNEEEQIYSVLEASVEATLIQEFMAEKERWEGTATMLLIALKMLNQGRISEEALPKNPAALSRRLRVLKPALETVGLLLSSDRGTERTIVICKITKNSVESVELVTEKALF